MSPVHDAAGDPRLLNGFLGLAGRVYLQDLSYIPAPKRELLAALDRPEFAGAQKVLVAVSGDHVVARLVVRVSPALRDGQGRPFGMIGFFEALAWYDDAVRALFEEGIAWLRQAGAGTIVGPMDGDTWHRYRLNAGPFDEPPFLSEPYNPPYYEALWTAAGFVPLERYASKRVEPAAVMARLEERRQAALAAGYRLRTLEPRRFRDELRTIYGLSRQIFSGNFLYTEIPEEEFFRLYAGARGLMQLMPETAERLGVKDINDPRENIFGGVRYLRLLANMFNGDLDFTVAAYNAGENAVIQHRGIPPYAQTRDYVVKVTKFYRRYRTIVDPVEASLAPLEPTLVPVRPIVVNAP